MPSDALIHRLHAKHAAIPGSGDGHGGLNRLGYDSLLRDLLAFLAVGWAARSVATGATGALLGWAAVALLKRGLRAVWPPLRHLVPLPAGLVGSPIGLAAAVYLDVIGRLDRAALPLPGCGARRPPPKPHRHRHGAGGGPPGASQSPGGKATTRLTPCRPSPTCSCPR